MIAYYLFPSRDYVVAENNLKSPLSANLTIYSATINGNTYLDYGQSGNIEIIIQNNGTTPSNNTTVSITTTNFYVVSLTDNENINLGSIAGNGGIGIISNKFLLEISDGVPDMYNISLTVTITADDTKEVWTEQITITTHAPNIAIGSLQITNDNNANGIIDAGENADLIISATNNGHASIPAEVLLEIVGTSEYFTINTTQYSIGDFSPSQSIDLVFNVTSAVNTPLETSITLQFDVLAGIYSSDKQFTIILGYIPEFNMTNGTEYVCYARFFDSGGENGEYGDDEDYTMTFFPTNSGNMLEVEFYNDFAIESCFYDQLKIYDGENTSAPLIEEFCEENEPSGTITATNDEGALTFQFHSDGSVTYAGWSATLECYNPNSPPSCTSLIFPENGQTDVYTELTLIWQEIDAATSYDIYYGTTLPETPNDNITGTEYLVSLEPNTTYEWKIIPKNEFGGSDYCYTWSLETGSETVIIENGTVTTCSAVLFDSGSYDNNYSANEDYTMTFIPEATENKLFVNFTGTFNIESSSDYLKIYDGADAEAPILAVLTGSSTPAETYYATNDEGKLTFVFHSDGITQNDGWEASIECYDATQPPTCSSGEYPENNSTGISYTESVLTWLSVLTATSYDVYFGETLPTTPTATVTTTSYSPTLTYNTTYYWKIIPKNDNGDAIGCETWNFTTVGQTVVMTNDEITTCNTLFFDSGNNDNEYSSGEDYTLTFLPAEAGYTLQADFNGNFNLESCCDYLQIYDGTNSSSTLIVELAGTTTPTEIYKATNSEGALTFVFHSDGSVQEEGWEAIISYADFVNVENIIKNEISIFPNPTTGIFTIETEQRYSNITIFDITGKTIKQLSVNNKQSSVDLSDYKSGIYFIKFQNNETVITKKLIVK